MVGLHYTVCAFCCIKRIIQKESDGKFEDYGYTQVEQLNKAALKVMDWNGQLYKINSFEFYRYRIL